MRKVFRFSIVRTTTNGNVSKKVGVDFVNKYILSAVFYLLFHGRLNKLASLEATLLQNYDLPVD